MFFYLFPELDDKKYFDFCSQWKREFSVAYHRYNDRKHDLFKSIYGNWAGLVTIVINNKNNNGVYYKPVSYPI